MNTPLFRVPLYLLVSVALVACSSSSPTDALSGPLTQCAYTSTPDGELIGAGCETAEDCGTGVCLKPGDGGNITNALFGFCTRSCNCNDDPNMTVESSHGTFSCVYPGGCFPGTGASKYRQVVPKCNSLTDCQAIDVRYTHCQATDSATAIPDTSCGHLHKVCQAK